VAGRDGLISEEDPVVRLKERIAIVTGGATGIGLAIVRRLAAEGASVVIADIKDADDAAHGFSESRQPVIGIETDVSSEESVARMVEHAADRFGRIDILVNNAAISATLALTPFEHLKVAEWRRVLDVNTVGVFLCCRAVAPHMRARKYGRIVNITSGTAFKGAPFLLHYVASKGAVMSMTRSLARELGTDDITVNAVSPGYTLSEGNLSNADFLAAHRDAAIGGRVLKRDAYPDDLVGGVAFLASDDAAFISGQILAVDGGSVFH
jgi:NAD(P)-dependent dehydrogenase (short-subunit alcohol dehydrogenase family)